MCQFKSGIILKDRIIIAPGADDSHSALLESLGIEDSYLGASKTFVRTELIPNQGKWWLDPSKTPDAWSFLIDQDITPDWFDKESIEPAFREAVCKWWSEHVRVGERIKSLDSGHYRLKDCSVEALYGDVIVNLYNTSIKKMWGSSQVGEMWESSQVGKMYDFALARDFHFYPKVRLLISENSEYTLVQVKQPSKEKETQEGRE